MTVSGAGLTNSVPVATAHRCAAEPDTLAVKVITRREGDETSFLVENRELCDVTMTFEMRLVNLHGATRFPYTTTFPACETNEAFRLTPIAPGSPWEYSYTNYYKIGSNRARHDNTCIYQLPFFPGAEYKVTQGYNSRFSHRDGCNQYAIDWKMPSGTPVCAARGGVVVRVKDDSDTGGPSMKFDRFNNFVLIRHQDGTLGHYCHLQKGGCTVKAGQIVSSGEIIGHSGNTGFSTGPHLHFSVFEPKNGRESQSIPVKFRTADDAAATLVEGQQYRAFDLRVASRRTDGYNAHHQATTLR